jgi:AcrR family transcriptional regulator
MTDSDVAARGRRLSPDTRRGEILAAARKLFSERPYTSVSTSDVAEAAGVARSLVHHYFGGIRELFFAVVAQGGTALAELRSAGPETPLDERLAYNLAAGLDVIAANRETWLAVAVYGASIDDPDIRQLVAALTDRQVDRMLTANSDVISDTPTTRHALRCFIAFATEATREWLLGEYTREETEALLVTAFRHLLLNTIPALEAGAGLPRPDPAGDEPAAR